MPNPKQGTPEWYIERAGHATGSCFADVMGVKLDGTPKKSRADYRMQLVVERLTGQPTPGPSSPALQWGTDCEPFARTQYEIETGHFVEQVGFIRHIEHEWIGSSADGLIDLDGAIEIKCPYRSSVHLNTWLHGMPKEHLPQVQGLMWVLDREWVDFCSFDPRMQGNAAHLILYIQRILRDDDYIKILQEEIHALLNEVKSECNALLAFKN